MFHVKRGDGQSLLLQARWHIGTGHENLGTRVLQYFQQALLMPSVKLCTHVIQLQQRPMPLQPRQQAGLGQQ